MHGYGLARPCNLPLWPHPRHADWRVVGVKYVDRATIRAATPRIVVVLATRRPMSSRVVALQVFMHIVTRANARTSTLREGSTRM